MPVTGGQQAAGAFRRAGAAVKAAVGEALEEAGEGVLTDMRMLAPMATGELAAALTMVRSDIDVDWLRVAVGLPSDRLATEYFYARFLEFGTKGGEFSARRANGKRYKVTLPPKPARPFMAPSIDMNINDIDVSIRNAIKSGLRSATGGRG